ncbi:MAG: hypothetical protein HY543_00565, partial [Deltaproteobacteria bacterium]|nr:hypothetical protein [Deltaproteobacteria bacterium]
MKDYLPPPVRELQRAIAICEQNVAQKNVQKNVNWTVVSPAIYTVVKGAIYSVFSGNGNYEVGGAMAQGLLNQPRVFWAALMMQGVLKIPHGVIEQDCFDVLRKALFPRQWHEYYNRILAQEGVKNALDLLARIDLTRFFAALEIVPGRKVPEGFVREVEAADALLRGAKIVRKAIDNNWDKTRLVRATMGSEVEFHPHALSQQEVYEGIRDFLKEKHDVRLEKGGAAYFEVQPDSPYFRADFERYAVQDRTVEVEFLRGTGSTTAFVRYFLKGKPNGAPPEGPPSVPYLVPVPKKGQPPVDLYSPVRSDAYK